jgi:histidinol-phosphate aminotransferase
MSLRVKETIRSIEPYKPGKPLEELERELGIRDAVKLASNENPLGPSRKALGVLKRGLKTLHRYPEGTGLPLREAIARKTGLSPDEVILGNGSDEIMDLAAKVFLSPGEEAIVGDRTFAIYSIAVRAQGGAVREVPLRDGVHDLEAMRRAVGPRTRLVFICNPNNPTGTMVTHEAVGRFLKGLPDDILVVLDEAYAEFADDPSFPRSDEFVRSGAPVLVLRTFSKYYGLAGLRIGYGLAPPSVVRELNRVRLPFNTNTLAQRAALAALTDAAHAARTRKVNREGRKLLEGAFGKMGLRFLPTQANFIYVNVGGDGQAVFDRLLREGVIVRPVTGGWIRVSIGLARENRRFIAALKKILHRDEGKKARRSE